MSDLKFRVLAWFADEGRDLLKVPDDFLTESGFNMRAALIADGLIDAEAPGCLICITDLIPAPPQETPHG